jgi:hypothetical protein
MREVERKTTQNKCSVLSGMMKVFFGMVVGETKVF